MLNYFSDKIVINSKLLRLFVLTVMACLLLSGSLLAQTTLVTVEGTISDKDGNGLPGASILVTNVESGFKHSGASRLDGRYTLSGIQAGKYECEVRLDGFATQVRKGLTFNVGSVVTLDFTLSQESLEIEVTVTAEVPTVEVTKSEVSSVVTPEDIDNLPMISRNLYELAALKAGVQEATAGQTISNALPGNAGEYLIDGVSNEEVLESYITLSVPADAIQEFKVLTNQFAAEYGNAAGVVLNAVTKSGTNEFRGRLSGFYRDEAFDAVNYFVEHDSYQGEKRSQEEIDELKEDFLDYRLGGYLGGPLAKDKFHFFLSYEYHKFRNYVTIGGTTLIPLQTFPQSEIKPMLLGKLSYQVNEKNILSFRGNYYNRNRNNSIGPLDSPERAHDRHYGAHAFNLNWTYFSSDNSMNELRLHYSKYRRESLPTGDWDAYEIRRPSGRFGTNMEYPQWFDEPRYQIVDNFSLFLGDHNVKFGFDFSYVDLFIHADILKPGMFQFFSDAPFDPTNPMTYPIVRVYNTGPAEFDTPFVNLGIFIQDSWKVSSRLTLNYGLRYNYFKSEVKVPETGELIFNLKSFDLTNFNPRFAFSWDPVGDGKTVVRGGVGTFSQNTEANHFSSVVVSGTLYTEFWPGYPDPSVPNPFSILFPDIFTHFTEPAEYYDFQDLKNPYSLQMTLGFQREIFEDVSAGVDLVWTKGINLHRLENQNPIIPGTGFIRPDMTKASVWKATNNGRSDYIALQFTLNKRYSHGWGFELSYSLSKSMADVELAGYKDKPHGSEEDAWDRRYGPTDYDARHRISFSGMIGLPLGFRMSAIFNYRSSTPWNAIYLTDVNRDGENFDYVDQQYNSRRGFDSFTLNVRISNQIRIGRFSVQPFLEVYNLTNRANFTSVYTRFDNPLFGIPLRAQDPRLIQLGVRLDF